MTIKLLDQKTIARIAAGEVVERPASVVKELVENSLDAGASHISIETRDGGTGFIRITDNGSGINTSEVLIAFKRHATSKLTRMEDLETIQTLGFRGEALPSIAAVAEVEMLTAVEGATNGDLVVLQDGVVVSHTPHARPQGTTVTIKNLFRNVPARLRFLKSKATENGHIAGIITQYALAYPEVKFTLTVDGRISLQTPGNGKLVESIMAIYGVDTTNNMVIIKREESIWEEGGVTEIKIDGMVSSPVVSRAGRDSLHFFINRRAINSRLLIFAVEEAYAGILMQGRHPLAVIDVRLPPVQVDVNVHPTKSEVRFHDERALFTAVQRAVRGALINVAPVNKIEVSGETHQGTKLPHSQNLWQLSGKYALNINDLPTGTDSKRSLPKLRVLGQVASNYIIAEGTDGIYIIDQHAAHERIMYEKIKRQWLQKQVATQGLLTPTTLELTPQQTAVIESRWDDLATIGFVIETFGEKTYLVRVIPAVLAGGDWLSAIREILDDPASGNERWEAMLKSLACHSVVRAGQSLTDYEMQDLIRQMEQEEQPFTCPHGRPTLINLTLQQLDKEFGRK